MEGEWFFPGIDARAGDRGCRDPEAQEKEPRIGGYRLGVRGVGRVGGGGPGQGLGLVVRVSGDGADFWGGSEAVAVTQGKQDVTGVISAVDAGFLNIDESVFESGIEEYFIPGSEGKGKSDAARSADIKALDAGRDIRICCKILGWNGVSLDGKGVTFRVYIDGACPFCFFLGMKQVPHVGAAVGIEDQGSAPGKSGHDR